VPDSARKGVVAELSTSGDEATMIDDEDGNDVVIGDIEEANDAATTDKLDVTLTTAFAIPFSTLCSSAASSLKLGINLVHQNARRMPRSTILCFRMNKTTMMKKRKLERIRTRSSQSDFSKAVTSCFDVCMTLLRISCCEEVERRVVVESSSIWLERTDRSSSVCIRAIVRRRPSVTSALAFIRRSSLVRASQLARMHGFNSRCTHVVFSLEVCFSESADEKVSSSSRFDLARESIALLDASRAARVSFRRLQPSVLVWEKGKIESTFRASSGNPSQDPVVPFGSFHLAGRPP
jgi:hypothetical protein